MTVKELIEALAEANPDAQVILQKDGEGNGYSPLEGFATTCIYRPDSTWSGSIVDTLWTSSEASMHPEEWEKLKQKPRCLLLYPVN